MNTASKLATFVITTTGALISHTSHSKPASFAPGLSGSISINAGFSQNQSQNNTHDDNSITNDLDNKGEQIEQAMPFVLGRLQYGFDDTIIFVGNSEDQITEAQFQAEFGISHQLSKTIALTTALFGNMPSMDEVWQDPYLTGIDREATEQSVKGIRFAIDLAYPLPVSLKYAYAQSEIDDEQIAQSQPLSDTDITLLDRESQYHRLGVEITLPLDRSLILAPAFYYTMRDAQGEANSFDALSAQLSMILSKEKHNLITTVRHTTATYDTNNPVFGLRHDYESFGIFSVYSYHQLFNWKNTHLNIMAGYQETESDIEFYSSENTFLSTGVSYSF